MGIQAGLSGGRGREKSASEEGSSVSEGQEYHASYNVSGYTRQAYLITVTSSYNLSKFPRARIFLDEYELALSEDCMTQLEEIETRQTTRSLRDFEAKFGINAVCPCSRPT